MPRDSSLKFLTQLDELKTQFGASRAKTIERLLARLRKQTITDADTLMRLHETLLFLRAYPQTQHVVQETESLLRQLPNWIGEAAVQGVDLDALDHPDKSGIAGRTVVDTFSYYILRDLVRRYPREVEFYWDWFEDENRLGEIWPHFMPLLEEDAFVEANIPYRAWLQAARGKTPDVNWLIEKFNRLPLTDVAKAELYNSQKLYVQWTPAYSSTRTGMRLPAKLRSGPIFFHREPLLQRRDVSLVDELPKPPPRLQKLSRNDGQTILDLSRDASTTRYRELYGFTHGDASRVLKAELGRGVDLFVMGLPPSKRLPLRAYHAAMIFKNQVPIGYFEGLSLCERMESGFNLYYTFREGETAWLYAKTLNVMLHLLGVTAFSLDPYQVGYDNEEGIESGAFWFYRKLGFRPTDRRLLKLAEQEEVNIRSRKGYRTSAPTLRTLARSPLIFELDRRRAGDWDRFQVRRIGFAVQHEMARRFDGDSEKMRTQALQLLLKTIRRRLTDAERKIFSDFAVVLLLIPDLAAWSREEKRGLLKIIESKAGRDEAKYLQLMQQHTRFRTALIDLGSR
jgi:hypothetical protein